MAIPFSPVRLNKDFFQKAALEVHDAEQKVGPKAPVVTVEPAPETAPDEQVCLRAFVGTKSDLLQTQTIKKPEVASQSLLPPPER